MERLACFENEILFRLHGWLQNVLCHTYRKSLVRARSKDRSAVRFPLLVTENAALGRALLTETGREWGRLEAKVPPLLLRRPSPPPSLSPTLSHLGDAGTAGREEGGRRGLCYRMGGDRISVLSAFYRLEGDTL
jgi:hypothetical protein